MKYRWISLLVSCFIVAGCRQQVPNRPAAEVIIQQPRRAFAIQLDTVMSEMGAELRNVGESEASFSVAEDRVSKSIDALAPLTTTPKEMRGVEDLRHAVEDLELCHRGYDVLSVSDLKSCLTQWRETKDRAFDELGASTVLKGLAAQSSQ